MLITHGNKCDAKWSGLRVEHCPACHKTFSGTQAGDKHRVGPANNRRCLPAYEMEKLTHKVKDETISFYKVELNAYGTPIWHVNKPREDHPSIAGISAGQSTPESLDSMTQTSTE